MSGYVYFDKTGVPEIDLILDRVYSASRAIHCTSGWVEPYDVSKGDDSETYVDRIQQAANDAALAWKALQEKMQVEVSND